MKKLLVLFVLVFTLSAFAFTFTACDKPEHVHDYKTVKYDSVNHWFECDCGEKSNTTTHTIVNGACVCGYVVPHTHEYSTKYTYDNEYHWFECECGEDKGKEVHVLNNNVCKCGYEKAQEHIHVFDKEIVKESFKKCDATCTEKAKYYVSCECGEKGDETFEVGFALEHNYGVWVSNGDGTHTKTCINDNSHKVTNDCSGGTATEEKRPVCSVCKGEYGSVLNHTHSFTVQITTDKFLLTKATCTNSAVYYYSCKCGEKGTETFIVGEVLGHNFENGACSLCGEKKVSKGLKFTLINNDTEYEVSGIGTCTDTDIIISDTYNGKPVTSIGDYVFSSYYSLQSVVIGNSVTSIGDYAFGDCDSLQSVVIGDSVTSIGYSAFSGCDSLQSVVIGDSVTSIGRYAFSACYNLVYNVKEGLKYLGNESNNYLCLIGVGNEYITTANIDSNCKIIGDYAFYWCDSLQSIVIGDSVTSIGNYAFYHCDSLQSVVIGDSVTSIGDHAFSSCDSLQSVVIGDSVTSIGNSAFYNCDSLQSVVIGDSVTSISYDAFSGCISLESVEIGNSVTSIGNYAFYNCTSLQSVVIPDSVISIDDVAFASCTSLQSIEVAEENTNYKDIDGNLYTKDGKTLVQYAVAKTATTFTIPNGVEIIGNCAFYECTSLQSVVMPDSVTSIGEEAFSYCDSLQSVEIPDSVTSIGNWTFYECTSLQSVEIPDSVTIIGGFTFAHCDSLQSVIIPDSVTSIGSGAFSGCDNLVYNVKEGLKYLGNENNNYLCLIGVENKNITTANIDSNCKIIGDSAFYECTLLQSVLIPDSVTSIGNSTFSYCRSLQSIVIPDSVISIGDVAFSECDSLQSIVIPDSVTIIGNNTFTYCDSLQSVEIPDSVISIGDVAFSECDSLQSIVIPDSVTSIGEWAFYGCDSLQSIVIPDSVTSIGDYAFYYCTSLKKIYCEAESRPEGWDSDWKYGCSAIVTWGYKG